MTIAWAETLEQVEDLARLEDEVADCAKLIGEAFQLGAVFIDGHVYLIETAQLGLEVDDMVQFVVKEEPLDVIPQGEGGEVGLVDDVEDRFGEGEKDPLDNASIRQLPVGVALRGEGGKADVFGQPELAENTKKQRHCE